ncbi:hypothetical protein VPH35_094745 [Triticum aestivum]
MSSTHGHGGISGAGYCATTKSFASLRPPQPLPAAEVPLTFPALVLSLLPSPLPAHPALLDAATGEAISYPAFLSQVRALVGALRSRLLPLGRGDVAFVLAPARLDVPVLHFALLAAGVIVSPANPALTGGEVARLVSLSGASIAFAVSSTAAKLPAGLPTVLLDSTHFRSLLHLHDGRDEKESVLQPLELDNGVVCQSATATIHYSSGTTGPVKAVAVPHRSLIAQALGFHALHLHVKSRKAKERTLMGAPMFHAMGFFFALNGLARGLTTVVMTDTGTGLRGMLGAAQRWEVTEIMASPPVVLGITKHPRRLPSLLRVICGGAPLPGSVAEQFRQRFPHVDLCVGYGSTETGGISLMSNQEECSRVGSAGRIYHNVEVRIVDIVTGEPLSVGQKGELCVRGPSIMTGYPTNIFLHVTLAWLFQVY